MNTIFLSSDLSCFLEARAGSEKVVNMWFLFYFLCCFIAVGVFSAPVFAHSVSNTATIKPPLPNSPAILDSLENYESPEEIAQWLRQQQLEINLAQTSLVHKLREFGIPVGLLSPNELAAASSSLLQQEEEEEKKQQNPLLDRVVTCTRSNPVDCRVTLGRAPLGHKCVAPCECTGSQKWVTFSVLNKLRRKDAQAWATCPTCRTPYRYELFTAHATWSTALLTALLDHMNVLRAAMALGVAIVAWGLCLPSLLMRFLVSRAFWQKFPQWSKIAHLPLAMKIWIGKLLFTFLWEKYLYFEKEWIVERLANLETAWLEETIPSPTDVEAEKSDDAAGEEEASEETEIEEES